MNLTQENIYRCLKTVVDPELGVNIVDLGLIYEVKIKGDKNTDADQKPELEITMTLTSPGCPLAGVFESMVLESLRVIDNLVPEEQVKITLTFDPPWTAEMMNPEVRAELGFD